MLAVSEDDENRLKKSAGRIFLGQVSFSFQTEKKGIYKFRKREKKVANPRPLGLDQK
jgi:hypothetical protein